LKKKGRKKKLFKKKIESMTKNCLLYV